MMRAEDLPLEQLLLDPNNYRLQDEEGYNPTPADRFHLEQVQRSTYQRIKTTGIKELHDSIITNGFLPIERIVVTPYAAVDGEPRFLVIEGNRRIAALRLIKQELEGGVEVPAEVAAVLAAIPCLVVDEGENAFFKETLMGVRHVGGIKQWGGYQRAKLIADMRDDHQLEPAVSRDVLSRAGVMSFNGHQLAQFLADHGIGINQGAFNSVTFDDWLNQA